MAIGDKILEQLSMPAVPTEVVRDIVADHYKRTAPTPKARLRVWVDLLVDGLGREKPRNAGWTLAGRPNASCRLRVFKR